MDHKDLFKKRKSLKDKKPEFVRQDSHKKAEVGRKWRRPKGLQSKMRLGKKGYRRSVEVGWGSPSEVKGLDRTGLKIVKVNNPADLDSINKEDEGVMISAGVGKRKKLEIAKKALEKGVTILNIKDVQKFVKNAEAEIEKKKEDKKKAKAEKDKKEKEKQAKAEKGKKEDNKESLAAKVDEEDKKKKEKEDKEKIITKKA